MVSEIHCDNATNFVGASRLLFRTFNDLIHHDDTTKFALENNLQFKFIPPRAPHHGGLWERAIQSAKHHLKRVIGEQILTLASA